jgi:hypothetical protein
VLTLLLVTLLLLRLVARHPGAVVMLVAVAGRLAPRADMDIETSVSLNKRDSIRNI